MILSIDILDPGRELPGELPSSAITELEAVLNLREICCRSSESIEAANFENLDATLFDSSAAGSAASAVVLAPP